MQELGIFSAVAKPQSECFAAGVLFARTEGIIPAPEPTHALAAVVEEAKRCAETGEAKVILTALCGHGMLDLAAYDSYLAGNVKDVDYPRERVDAALTHLPQIDLQVLFLGTSGWQYAHWRGRLYPSGVPQRRWLEHFAENFATVEINAAFYRLPRRSTFEDWAARTPSDMVFAVKASRYLTHVRRLREPAEPVARLMVAAGGLGGKLGPVLLQLPPTLQADAAALDAVLAAFPAGVRVAVEPRHASWDSDEIRSVLERRAAAVCWADNDERPVTPLWKTAEWGYLRLHAGRGTPPPGYRDKALLSWADRLTATFSPAADAYVYTNNDPDGAALRDVVRLAGMLRDRGRQTSRTPA